MLRMVFAGQNYAVRYDGDDPTVVAILRTLDIRTNAQLPAIIRAAMPHIPRDAPQGCVFVVLHPRLIVSKSAANAIAAAVDLKLHDETGAC